jgi:hypothetical protein
LLNLKRLAMTSVAYMVTLLVISSVAASQLNTSKSKLEAETVQQADRQLVAAASQPRLIEAKKQVSRSKEQSRKDYFATKRDALTGEELSELLTLVGFEGKAHKTAWSIVMRESNARPRAHNGNTSTGDNSYGLFQINMIGTLGADRRAKFELKSNEELFNSVRNAEIVYYMTRGGNDFGSWGIGPNAYRSGAGESTIMRWYDKYPGVNK